MHPIKIEVKNKERLEITWDDGNRTSISLKYLRQECPCAQCKGETILLRSIKPPKLLSTGPEMNMIAGIEITGGYGLRVTWKDGHGTGIYNYEYLQELAADENSQNDHNYEPLV